jgi:predicted AAA+ superfamily ATPase
LKYIERTISGHLAKASGQFPVVLVTGARQVGKTTVLQRMREAGRTYLTLDDPRLLTLAKGDPALFLQRFHPPVLIDEIQYAPELLPYIKMEADAAPKPGMFWITGSQQFHLMKGVSESLAGRVAVLRLLGLSWRERIGRADAGPFLPDPAQVAERAAEGGKLPLGKLYHLIWRGSFPAIASNPGADRDLFYSSYLQTYLQRDVRDLAKVGDKQAFLRFLKASAARSGQMLNLADLARDADVAPNTAKTWLSILEASGLVWLLPPWHSNLTKRLVKTPKLYFLDTGLCAYLTEWSTPETLEAGAMCGPILETWIVAELLKSYLHHGLVPPFYYYRDKDKKEIDLLIVRDNTIYPLECKKTASPGKKDVRHFATLANLAETTGPGGVVCLAADMLPLAEGIYSIPVSAL